MLLFSFALSNTTVEISSDTTEIKTFQLSYLINKDKKLNFEDVLSVKFQDGKNSDTLGANVTNTWIKIALHNSTSKEQKLVLHQELGYTFLRLNYYEVDSKNILRNTKEFLIYSPYANEHMDGADATFRFTLKAYQAKTIYIHQQTNAYHFYNYSLLSEKNSIKYLIYEKVDSILLIGLLLALIIYNMLIYYSSGYKEYLYYSLYLLFATLWIFYMYGALAHYIGVYGALSYRFNFGLMISPIFLTLFIQTLFKTKEKYKTEHKFLNSVIFVLIVNILYGLVDFNSALKLLAFILDYVLIVFMWVSISLYKKGDKLVKIFLIAHTFYLIFNVYALLFYMGLVDFNYVSSHGIGIGILIEALLLAYLLAYKLKIVEKEKELQRGLKVEAIKEQNKSQLLLLQKSKMADMGEMIGNIAHQWKQPLAVVGMSVAILREKKLMQKLSDEECEEELKHIDSNILHMSHTVDDFLTYFKPNKIKSDFFLKDAVDKALLIIGYTLYKNDIKLHLSVDEKQLIYGLKEEFIQVLISILQNSIDALEARELKVISIVSKRVNESIVLELSDNAGGIEEELLFKIFDAYFTTKHATQGTGLGLYIAKEIIEKSMEGRLSVENIEEGILFSIEVKSVL